MKLANWAQGAAVGAVAGGFAGFVFNELGLADILSRIDRSSIVVLSMIVGGLVGAFQRARLIVWLDLALALAYFIVASTPLMAALSERWVRVDPLPAAADAIVVLSSAVKSDSALDANGVERLLTGIELYQRGIAPRLFTTRVEVTYPDGTRSSTSDQRRLIRLGGALSAWTMLDGVFSTRDEALQSAVKLPLEARTIIVVTSPMHTRRACGTFEAVGFKVICQPSREEEHVTWQPMTPSDRLASFRDYVYERLGMVKYRAKGWLPAT